MYGVVCLFVYRNPVFVRGVVCVCVCVSVLCYGCLWFCVCLCAFVHYVLCVLSLVLLYIYTRSGCVSLLMVCALVVCVFGVSCVCVIMCMWRA